MTVWFVGAGPGDPDLMTVKARKLVEGARCCVYAGSLVSPEVVALLPKNCEKHDSAGMDLEATTAVCADCHARGIDMVRLHTGDPSIYGAINEQMRRLESLNIHYEVVPGVSAFQAAAAALKTELTAPEISQTVILSRAAGRTPVPEEEALPHLAATRATLCLFLSVDQITGLCAELIPHYGEDCPAAVVYHASWPDQKIVRGTLADLPKLAEGIKKTALVVVGRALAKTATESKLYDAAFTHGYRKGSEK